MYLLTQSCPQKVYVRLSKPGISSPSITISKNCSGFGAINDGSWTELIRGLYTVGLNAIDTSVIGPMMIRVSTPGCDDVFIECQVKDPAVKVDVNSIAGDSVAPIALRDNIIYLDQSITSAVNSLQPKDAVPDERIDDLVGKVTSLIAVLPKLSTTMKQLTLKLDTPDEDQVVVSKSIDALKQTITTSSSVIDDLAKQLATTQKKLSGYESQFKTVGSILTDVNHSVSNIESTVNAIESTTSNIPELISDIQPNTDPIVESIHDLQTNFAKMVSLMSHMGREVINTKESSDGNTSISRHILSATIEVNDNIKQIVSQLNNKTDDQIEELITSTMSGLNSVSKLITGLNPKFDTINKSLAELDECVVDLHSGVVTTNDSISTLKEVIISTSPDLSPVISKVESEIGQIGYVLNSMNSNITATRQDITEINTSARITHEADKANSIHVIETVDNIQKTLSSQSETLDELYDSIETGQLNSGNAVVAVKELNILSGVITHGSIADTVCRYDHDLVIQEVGGSIDIRIDFNIGDKMYPSHIAMYGQLYESAEIVKQMDVWGWCWSTNAWIKLSPLHSKITHSNKMSSYIIPFEYGYYVNHVGAVRFKFYGHGLTAKSHLSINYLMLDAIPYTTPDRIWSYDKRTLTSGTKDDEIEHMYTKIYRLDELSKTSELIPKIKSETEKLVAKVDALKPNNELIPYIRSKTDKMTFNNGKIYSYIIEPEEMSGVDIPSGIVSNGSVITTA